MAMGEGRHIAAWITLPAAQVNAAERRHKSPTLRRPARHPEFEVAASYAYFAGRQEAPRRGHFRNEASATTSTPPGPARPDVHARGPLAV